MEKADILIKNGQIIDPCAGTNKHKDIAIKGDRIITAENCHDAVQVVDASGCLVVPGLIDYHSHIAANLTDVGIWPTVAYFPTGVTTAVDAGSTGVSNYRSFRAQSIAGNFRVKAFLNVCSAGLSTTSYHENIDPSKFDRQRIKSFMAEYADQLIGLKVRLSKEIAQEFGIQPLEQMISLAEEIGCPVVVHTTNPAAHPEEIAAMLRPGDIYAHVFQGKGETIIRNEKVIPDFYHHQKRGVIFDAANGTNHFSFKVAKAALKEGFLPDIISTDLTTKSLYKTNMVFSLPFVMSKYLALGLTVEEILKRVTINPARLLGLDQELGSLAEGTKADIAILREVKKPVTFSDYCGDEVHGDMLLRTEMTIFNGITVFRQIDF